MKIGFPIVVTTLDSTSCVVSVWLSAEPSTSFSTTLSNASDQRAVQIVSDEGWPAAYKEIRQRFIERGLSLRLDIDGSNDARREVFKDSRLFFDGASGTLALFLLFELYDEIANATSNANILISGVVKIINSNWTVHPLGESASDKTIAKWNHAKNNNFHFWIHSEDQKFISDQMEYLKPFEADNGTMAWLKDEFVDAYQLARVVTVNSSGAVAKKVSILTERNLFQHAIDRAALDSFDEKLDSCFAELPARELLPIQKQALNDENVNSLFAPMGGESDKLRHVLISGPTGCGKTTLLNALVLNGLHNRGGGVIYLGPTRALVEEFYATVSRALKPLLPEQPTLRILLSTGDYYNDDALIVSGRFGLACMVTEKANLLFSSDDIRVLVKNVTMLIIDELHMLADHSRGGLLDLLVTNFSLHARRQWANRVTPLQIIGITTETLAERLKTLETFKLDPDDENTVPCALSATHRPIPLQHTVAVIYETQPKKDPKWVLKPFLEFNENKDRAQSSAQLAVLLKKFNPHGNSEIDNYKTRAQAGDGKIDGQIFDLILAQTPKHKTMIVVVDAIDKTENFASAICARLPIAPEPCVISDEFIHELKISGITQQRIDRMTEWAVHGIYIHNAQLPRKLRGAIENVFRSSIKNNDRHKILFATETLTYGVNLNASCIILTTIEMKRDDPADPFSPPIDRPLDSNQYHNILGRAGRLGYKAPQRETAEAIVCLKLSDFDSAAKQTKFLTRYYGEGAKDGMLSAIALSSDIENIRWDKKNLCFKEQNYKNAEDYSFTLLRTTLDAARKAGSGGLTSVNDLIGFVKCTVGYQSASEGLQDKLVELCKYMLVKADEYDGVNIDLLNSGDIQYALQPAGAALIDTGTSLQSVSPLADWLRHLGLNKGTTVRVEGLIPGLIFTPDFTKIAGELVPEARYEKAITPNSIKIWMDAAVNNLNNELLPLGLSPLLDLLLDFMDLPAFINVFRNQPNRDLKKISVIKLFTLTLMWLRGSTIDAMVAISKCNLPDHKGKEWGQKYAERIENLCRMCYRFFANARGYLTEEQQRQLPRLAMRLKHGLPFDALPFLNVLSLDGVLPREAVVQLHKAAPNPFALLGENYLILAKVDSVLNDFPHANVHDAAGVMKIVRKAYASGLASFLKEVGRGDAESFIDAVTSVILPANIDDAFSKNWKITDLINCDLNENQDRNIRSIKRIGCMAVEEIRGTEKLIFTTNEKDAGIQLNGWHKVPIETIWSATPCGYILLVSLVLRGIISIQDVGNKMNATSPVRIDVNWVAVHLLGGEDIGKMPNFHEFLLAFVEPVLST